jgi:hypothetical protein
MNQVVSKQAVKTSPAPHVVSKLPSPFRTPRGEAEYMAAYKASMQLWTVPYEAWIFGAGLGARMS